MEPSQRRLPHTKTAGQPLFVTFRLHGSLPANRAFPREQIQASGRAFVAMDKILDRAATGPLHLKRPENSQAGYRRNQTRKPTLPPLRVARIRSHGKLRSPVGNANIATAKWLGPLKGYTSHEANSGPTLLARRKLRPPSQERRKFPKNPGVHRTKSSESRSGRRSQRLPAVRRGVRWGGQSCGPASPNSGGYFRCITPSTKSPNCRAV